MRQKENKNDHYEDCWSLTFNSKINILICYFFNNQDENKLNKREEQKATSKANNLNNGLIVEKNSDNTTNSKIF